MVVTSRSAEGPWRKIRDARELPRDKLAASGRRNQANRKGQNEWRTLCFRETNLPWTHRGCVALAAASVAEMVVVFAAAAAAAGC